MLCLRLDLDWFLLDISLITFSTLENGIVWHGRNFFLFTNKRAYTHQFAWNVSLSMWAPSNCTLSRTSWVAIRFGSRSLLRSVCLYLSRSVRFALLSAAAVATDLQYAGWSTYNNSSAVTCTRFALGERIFVLLCDAYAVHVGRKTYFTKFSHAVPLRASISFSLSVAILTASMPRFGLSSKKKVHSMGFITRLKYNRDPVLLSINNFHRTFIDIMRWKNSAKQTEKSAHFFLSLDIKFNREKYTR